VRAVVIQDGRLRWEEREDPVPGDTELLVAVRAAGINSADLVQRAGFYPAPPGWPPDIPGMEFAGEVVGVGSAVRGWQTGDRVMAVVGGGAQAMLAVVDESHALAVPDGLSWPEAGGFPEAFSTAHDALFTQAGLAPRVASGRRACSLPWQREPLWWGRCATAVGERRWRRWGRR
jgi:NADPH:quinone reductase